LTKIYFGTTGTCTLASDTFTGISSTYNVYTINGASITGFTFTDVSTLASISALLTQCHTDNVTAIALKAAGYSATQLQAAGYSATQLQAAGYSALIISASKAYNRNGVFSTGLNVSGTINSDSVSTLTIPVFDVSSNPYTSIDGATFTINPSSSAFQYFLSGISLTVQPGTPSLIWNQPAAITYGTELSSTQLNATSNVSGTNFVYDPSGGIILHPQILTVYFTPSDSNYTSISGSVSLTVQPKTLTISGLTALNKEYDGTTSVTLSGGTLFGVVGSDQVSFDTSGSFQDASTGYNKTVQVMLSLTGADKDNYIFDPSHITLQANIVKDTLEYVEITKAPIASSITYGQTLSASTLSGGIIQSNGLTISGVFAFADPSVQATSFGTLTTEVIFTPEDTADYSSNIHLNNFEVNVQKALLTISGSKIFDGTKTFRPNQMSVEGIAPNETITSAEVNSPFINEYSDAILTISNGLVSNYIINAHFKITPPIFDGLYDSSFTILKAPLTISGDFVVPKSYDGTRQATVSGGELVGIINGDQVFLQNYVGSYDTSAAGTGISVLTEYTISGANAGNYSLTNHTLLGDIEKDILTEVSNLPTATSIVYGQTLASSTLTAGVVSYAGQPIPGSFLFLYPDRIPTFTDTQKVEFRPTDMRDYSSNIVLDISVVIQPKLISISGSKVYNGTGIFNQLQAEGILSYDTIFSLTTTNIHARQEPYTNTDDVIRMEISGNYDLSSVSLSILPRRITISGSKKYDRTGQYFSQNLSVQGMMEPEFIPLLTIPNQNVIEVYSSIADIVFDVSHGFRSDYDLSSASLEIRPAPLTISGSKIYDGTVWIDINTLELMGAISPEMVSLSGGTAKVENSGNAGDYDHIVLDNIYLVVEGGTAANYTLSGFTI